MPEPMKLYHTTTDQAADSIMAGGFVDAEGSYMTTNVYRGIWLADRPLDINEGAVGETVLTLEIPEGIAAEYEWIEEGKPYREFLVPAAVINESGPAVRRDLWELREELAR